MRLLVLPRLALLVWAIVLLLGSLPTRGADGGADADAALRQKADEVERLRQELDRAQSDLKRLEAENQKLREEKTHPPAPGATVSTPAAPVPAIATLPPLEPGACVDVVELAEQFRTEPEAAQQRYRKKTFRVKGEVARFSPKILVQYYEVILRTPDKSVTVTFGFNYLERYKTVYTKESGEVLVGVQGHRQEVPLLRVGEPVEIEATCEGLDGRKLSFHGSRVVKP
jgi:hypothetical protein